MKSAWTTPLVLVFGVCQNPSPLFFGINLIASGEAIFSYLRIRVRLLDGSGPFFLCNFDKDRNLVVMSVMTGPKHYD